MIIVSQDRSNIINFKRITSVWISNDTKEYFEINADGELLGNYKTEKRAKEVLKSITAMYQLNKLLECTSGIEEQNQIVDRLLEAGMKPFGFEMPEE